MKLNGKPYVPPLCYSRDGEDIDLETVDFRLAVHETPELGIVEVGAVFEEIDRGLFLKGSVFTGVVDFPIDSPQAHRAKRLVADTKTLEKLRAELLERIRGCKGIRSGVCWALGEEHFAVILERYLAG